tara:strand:- start:14424 stop:14900 length:477 start_codon:yes stop_codon:yes gene_type:complete
MSSLEDLVINLNTIGRLRQGDKLSVYCGRFYISEHTYFRSVKRYFGNQNRNDTIQYVSSTVNYSITYAKSLLAILKVTENSIESMEEKNRDEVICLYHPLQMCLGGLTHLIESYSDDRTCLSQIDIIRTNIIQFIEECKDLGIESCLRKKHNTYSYNL